MRQRPGCLRVLHALANMSNVEPSFLLRNMPRNFSGIPVMALIRLEPLRLAKPRRTFEHDVLKILRFLPPDDECIRLPRNFFAIRLFDSDLDLLIPRRFILVIL
jgi:hypothetical protein